MRRVPHVVGIINIKITTTALSQATRLHVY